MTSIAQYSAAVEFASSQWKRVSTRAHYTMNEDGVPILTDERQTHPARAVEEHRQVEQQQQLLLSAPSVISSSSAGQKRKLQLEDGVCDMQYPIRSQQRNVYGNKRFRLNQQQSNGSITSSPPSTVAVTSDCLVQIIPTAAAPITNTRNRPMTRQSVSYHDSPICQPSAAATGSVIANSRQNKNFAWRNCENSSNDDDDTSGFEIRQFIGAFEQRLTYSKAELARVTKIPTGRINQLVAKYCDKVSPLSSQSKVFLKPKFHSERSAQPVVFFASIPTVVFVHPIISSSFIPQPSLSSSSAAAAGESQTNPSTIVRSASGKNVRLLSSSSSTNAAATATDADAKGVNSFHKKACKRQASDDKDISNCSVGCITPFIVESAAKKARFDNADEKNIDAAERKPVEYCGPSEMIELQQQLSSPQHNLFSNDEFFYQQSKPSAVVPPDCSSQSQINQQQQSEDVENWLMDLSNNLNPTSPSVSEPVVGRRSSSSECLFATINQSDVYDLVATPTERLKEPTVKSIECRRRRIAEELNRNTDDCSDHNINHASSASSSAIDDLMELDDVFNEWFVPDASVFPALSNNSNSSVSNNQLDGTLYIPSSLLFTPPSSSSEDDQFIPFHLPYVSSETAGSTSSSSDYYDSIGYFDYFTDAHKNQSANNETIVSVDDSFNLILKVADGGSKNSSASAFKIKNIVSTANLMHSFTRKEIELLDQQPWISSWFENKKKSKPKKVHGGSTDNKIKVVPAAPSATRGSFKNPLIMNIRDEAENVCANLTIYASGKIVCRSAKTIQESEKACRMCAQRLQQLLFGSNAAASKAAADEGENSSSIQLAEFEIVNIVASFSVEASVKLIDIVQELGELRPKRRSALATAHYATKGIPLMAYADEENDKFSNYVGATATYRVTATVDEAMKRKEKNITTTMFSNGNATIMGATDVEQIRSIVEHVEPVMRRHSMPNQPRYVGTPKSHKSSKKRVTVTSKSTTVPNIMSTVSHRNQLTNRMPIMTTADTVPEAAAEYCCLPTKCINDNVDDYVMAMVGNHSEVDQHQQLLQQTATSTIADVLGSEISPTITTAPMFRDMPLLF